MPAEGKRTRIAVLIDADNASARHAEAIFTEIAKLGEAVVRRIYGDFSSPGLRGWNDKLSRHALIPVQTVAYTKGKNASDIALVIDAMDLMHSGLYDGFCIVSSDSDFTRPAQRIRESGAEVYGFGEHKSPESFRQSCRRFFFVENLARDQAADGVDSEPELQLPEETVRPASESVAIIGSAYDRHVGDHADGWVPIRTLQRTIANIAADFDPRTFGEHRLGDLALKTGIYDVKNLPERKWSIRRKSTRPAPKPVQAARPAAKPARAPARPARAQRTAVEASDPNDGLNRTLAKAAAPAATRQQPARQTQRRTHRKPNGES